MKIYLLVFLTILLSNCKSTEVAYQPSTDLIASGTIDSPDVTSFQYGSHVLLGKDKKIRYALKSESVDLDGYLSTNVQLGGNKIAGYPLEGGPALLDVVWIKKTE